VPPLSHIPDGSMDGPSAGSVGKADPPLLPLIVAAVSKDAIPFTLEEIDWIVYYAKEMTSLADWLLQAPRPQGKHYRQTMRDKWGFAESEESFR
jgi:hypothetical protein